MLTESVFYLRDPLPLQFVNFSTSYITVDKGRYFVKYPDNATYIVVSLLPVFEMKYEIPTNSLKKEDDVFVLAEGEVFDILITMYVLNLLTHSMHINFLVRTLSVLTHERLF